MRKKNIKCNSAYEQLLWALAWIITSCIVGPFKSLLLVIVNALNILIIMLQM